MAEYICEYCNLPITHETVDIAYVDGRLVYFHPMRCPVFSNGTDCVVNYFLGRGELWI